ncbi:MAG: hypothetical protein BKP49_08155 [Treponema sp. CETP13]|nr:MAG: hypothetical protein BKP49_08155 [Treponema sp. CETP13]
MKPTLMVLAAGMGSRYGGVKQIDSVGRNGETLLDFATYDAKVSGFGKVVYIIRKDIEKDFRERFFNRVARNFDADYVFQTADSIFTESQKAKISKTRTKPWGTMHAILCAEKAVKEPFAVINADDYYGRKAFEIQYEHLSKQGIDSVEHSMVGYVLENTMSKEGSVSRGVCVIEDGYLKSMDENLKIYYENGKVISERPNGKFTLTGKEWVSMNLFGFTQKAFEGFHTYWDNFVANNISEEKAEALLPVAAGDIVKRGDGKVKFYSSPEKWFGMTYPKDKEIVKSEIAKKIDSGYYPELLWEK